MTTCPICGLEGGFHDHDSKQSKHAAHEIPQESLKEPGWVKAAHEKLKWKKVETQVIDAVRQVLMT